MRWYTGRTTCLRDKLTGPVLINLHMAPDKWLRMSESAPEIEFLDLQSGELLPETLAKIQAVFGGLRPEQLARANSLMWIQLGSAGADRIADEKLYAGRDIVLTNATGAFGISVSEHMLAMILTLLRNLPDYVRNHDRHIWKKQKALGSVYGARALVIGLGDIGLHLAVSLHAMGAQVTGIRRNPSLFEKPDCVESVSGPEGIDEVIREADIVALCLPATAETTGILSAARIDRMKSRAIVVNAGRGSAIDQEALVRALEEGRIGGAGLDVTVPEPLPEDHPLWKLPQVLITPHAAGGDSLPLISDRVFDIFMENLERARRGAPLGNVVDRSRGY